MEYIRRNLGVAHSFSLHLYHPPPQAVSKCLCPKKRNKEDLKEENSGQGPGCTMDNVVGKESLWKNLRYLSMSHLSEKGLQAE